MKRYDLFISYSRKDKDIAEEICHILDEYKKHYNFEYFFDCEEISSKHDYLERISSAISQSKAILFLASKNSLTSEFCLKELLFADKEHVYIHQYRLDSTEYPKPIQLLLGNYHYREAKNFTKNEMVREVLTGALNQDVKNLHLDQKVTFFMLYWSRNIKWILIGLCLPLVFIALFGLGGIDLLLNKSTNKPNVSITDSIKNNDTIENLPHREIEESIEEAPQPAAENIAKENNNLRHMTYAGVPMNMDINSFANRLKNLNYQLTDKLESQHFYKFKQNGDIIRVHWDEQNNKVYLVEVICHDLTGEDLNDIMYAFADEYGQEPQPFNEWAEGICLEEGAILFGLDDNNHVVIMYLDKYNSEDYKLL